MHTRPNDLSIGPKSTPIRFDMKHTAKEQGEWFLKGWGGTRIKEKSVYFRNGVVHGVVLEGLWVEKSPCPTFGGHTGTPVGSLFRFGGHILYPTIGVFILELFGGRDHVPTETTSTVCRVSGNNDLVVAVNAPVNINGRARVTKEKFGLGNLIRIILQFIKVDGIHLMKRGIGFNINFVLFGLFQLQGLHVVGLGVHHVGQQSARICIHRCVMGFFADPRLPLSSSNSFTENRTLRTMEFLFQEVYLLFSFFGKLKEFHNSVNWGFSKYICPFPFPSKIDNDAEDGPQREPKPT
jgi:hypothetical protein